MKKSTALWRLISAFGTMFAELSWIYASFPQTNEYLAGFNKGQLSLIIAAIIALQIAKRWI
ncbi:MAG: hypothetical protein CL823_02970 [Crocinitomicaceae bacterium]|nr:hypothetical protein [Crocinitomicaceae bacterium]